MSTSNSGVITAPATWRLKAAYQKSNPFRKPAWCWDLACRLVETNRRSPPRRLDYWLAGAVSLNRKLRQVGPDGLSRVADWRPTWFEAHQIFSNGGFVKWRLEAWLLTGISLKQVVEKCLLRPGTVRAYEAIFYSVRDRLDAREYVRSQVIGLRSASIVFPTLEKLIKWYAYSLGPLVLEKVLNVVVSDQGEVRPADKLDLSTADGRTAMRTRLAVVAQMLPQSEASLGELLRMLELIRQMDRTHEAKRSLDPVFAGLSDQLIDTCFDPNVVAAQAQATSGSQEPAPEATNTPSESADDDRSAA